MAALAARLEITAAIVPMSDAAVRTRVTTADGELAFQEYFVRERCLPIVTALKFAGADRARVSARARAALTDAAVAAIIICPSNPYLSIDPILAVPGFRELLEAARAPVIAVTPLVAGRAIKGPTAKIMAELGLEPAAATVAAHYAGLIDGFVQDAQDRALASLKAAALHVTDTVMVSLADRERLAREVLEFAARLHEAGSARA
jgi:LPPG:FO 2-phospho-L-lactate transferase